MLVAALLASAAVVVAGEADNSWLARAGAAGRQAGTALYQGVQQLACLKLECCTDNWRPANYTRLEQLLGSPHVHAVRTEIWLERC